MVYRMNFTSLSFPGGPPVYMIWLLIVREQQWLALFGQGGERERELSGVCSFV
jgi:hypothetical protein